MILVILSIFGLFLIPLSIRYFLNPSRIRVVAGQEPTAGARAPVLGIPGAEFIFLTSAFFLLKPPVASSFIFKSLPHSLQIASIVAFLLAGDVLFKALLSIGVDPQSEHEMAPTLLKVFIIHGRVFGGHLMNLARHLLGIHHDLLNCVGSLGRTLCGLGDEPDRDMEAQTDVTPPSYNDLQHHHESGIKLGAEEKFLVICTSGDDNSLRV